MTDGPATVYLLARDAAVMACASLTINRTIAA
jgi:hypothetical protein